MQGEVRLRVSQRRITAGHHDVDPGAVLAAVQTSVLRTDRCAAAGLDPGSARRVYPPDRGIIEEFFETQMRPFGFVLLLTVFLASVSVDADTGFVDRRVTVDGSMYRYQVYVPADYTASRRWPMIVYLHGNRRQGSDGIFETQGGMGDMIRVHRDAVPAIVVFPQAATGQFWEQPSMQGLVVAEMDATEKEFRIDAAREYLTGFSMGAAGAYRLAYKWPDRFAALVADAGTIGPVPPFGGADRPDIDKRANPFTAESDPFTALATRIKHLPIWIFHGDSDAVVPIEQSRRLVSALKAVGADVRYTEIPGAGHIDGAAKTFGNVEMISWLLAQHR